MRNKEILIVALKLFVITAVAALCLATVNKITKPIIAQNNAATEVKLQQEVLPEASEFTSSEVPNVETDNVTVEKINVGLDDNKALSGYVVTAVSHAGYGGDLKVMVGIDKDLKVTRVKIMESSETAGLGANASKPQFIDQFMGAESSELKVVKGVSKDNEISAIASATVTSKAVTACVNASISAAKAKSESGELEKTAKKLEEIKQETENQISQTDKEEGK